MLKNIALFFSFLLLLNACQSYSDEMVFYYEDEEAQPDAMAAPSTQVSSEELVIPTELRERKAAELASQKAEDEYVHPLEKNINQNGEPTSILHTNNISTQKTETKQIPVSYGNDDDTQNIKNTNSAFVFDASEITPKVYAIAATRATNKMLDDTQRLYQQQENKPKLLVLKTKKINQSLPDGLNYANKVVYDIIDGSQNFTLVPNLDEADYVLDVKVDAYAAPNTNSPVIVYMLTLQDKNGKEIDSWVQDIRQLQNDDKSWW